MELEIVADGRKKMAEKNGIRYAQQMAGHTSSKYIWRYVQPSRDDMEEAIDDLFA